MSSKPQENKVLHFMKNIMSVNTAVTLGLIIGMLSTGTMNTLFTKQQDRRIVKGTGDTPATAFEHAFFQTACMFTGEFLCLFAYQTTRLLGFIGGKIRAGKQPGGDALASGETSSLVAANGNGSAVVNASESSSVADAQPAQQQKPYVNPLIFWLPAACDLGGSTLLNVGLFLTTASVYQMLRGTLVIFTAILSIIVLKQKRWTHHWAGVALIFIGTGIVGLSSYLNANANTEGARNPMLGNALVVLAQVIAACQFILEEKFMAGQPNIAPLQVVGWEGYYGLCMSTIALFILYWIPGTDAGSLENAPYAMAQILHDWPLALSVVGSICSIAFFNFFGIFITKRVSSTTRATIDSCRTMFIWAISLTLGWETFHYLQVVGFAVLVIGSLTYNEVIPIPFYTKWYKQAKIEYLAEQDRKAAERKAKKLAKKLGALGQEQQQAMSTAYDS